MVNKRLIDISSNEVVFNEAKKTYQDALTKAGHKHTLIFEENRTRRPRKARSRKVTWYNPPWDNNAKGSLGKKFLQLVDKHFPKNHELSKILNRSTLKISYSMMPNMKSIISAINRKKLDKTCNSRTNDNALKCTCHNKNDCPFVNDGKCSLKLLSTENPDRCRSN